MNPWPPRRFRVTPLRAIAAFFIILVLFWIRLLREDVPRLPCSVPEEFTERLHQLAYRFVTLPTIDKKNLATVDNLSTQGSSPADGNNILPDLQPVSKIENFQITFPTFVNSVAFFSVIISTIRVHLVLAKLGLVHFLCFGALWGQVRIGRALPWARKVELCMVDSLRDDGLITKAFREEGLSASYLYASGIYRVQEHEVGEDAPKLEITVFEEDSVTQMVRRVGWTRRVLPPDCELSPSLQCFPPQLAIAPLPIKQFGGHLIPVPREGIELQKYHYPNDWWLEIKPTDCIEQNQGNT